MTKYKYYLKKPKGEIVQDILLWLAVAGIITTTIVAPNSTGSILKLFLKNRRYKSGSAESAFRRLIKEGSIAVDRAGGQIYISLTDKGKRKAGWLQINNLVVKKRKKWDGRWHIVIFDIAHTEKFMREALRGFLKRLEFCQLQKSVWIGPHYCRDEIELLKDFFGLSDAQLRLIVAVDIGDDSALRKHFGIR